MVGHRMTIQPDAAPAHLVISRVMRPGHEDDYDGWAGRVVAAAQAQAAFASAVRLDQAGGLHHLLLQFGSVPALRAWTEAWAYRRLAGEADSFSVALDQQHAGATVRFDLPSDAAAKKWKTALITWIGVVPTLLILSTAIRWAFPAMPRLAQQILSSILLTATLTWIILPRVRGWSRFWMLQNSQGDLRKEEA